MKISKLVLFAGLLLIGGLFLLNNPSETVLVSSATTFAMMQTDNGGKCGDGKCGGDKATDKQAKKEDAKAAKDGKCGDGKCGEGKASDKKEGKCGDGKCGDSMKPHEYG